MAAGLSAEKTGVDSAFSCVSSSLSGLSSRFKSYRGDFRNVFAPAVTRSGVWPEPPGGDLSPGNRTLHEVQRYGDSGLVRSASSHVSSEERRVGGGWVW